MAIWIISASQNAKNGGTNAKLVSPLFKPKLANLCWNAKALLASCDNNTALFIPVVPLVNAILQASFSW